MLFGSVCCAWSTSASGSAQAPAETPSIDWRLPPQAELAELGGDIRLYGVPADIRYFAAALPVSAMIAHLQAHHPWLRDLAVLPGMAVLSGPHAGCTVSATVTGVGKGRSEGTLSQVCWPARHLADDDQPDWLPVGAQRVFDFSSRDEQGVMRQQIWRYAAQPASLRVMVRQRLSRLGWMPLAGPATGEAWRRGTRELIWDVLPTEEGSAIVAWLPDQSGDTP